MATSVTTTTSQSQTASDTSNYVLRLTRPFRVGDVLYVRRYITDVFAVQVTGERGLTLYHHAGIVSQVDDDGNIRAVVHFDPAFDASSNATRKIPIHQAIIGVMGRPEEIDGKKLEKAFPVADLEVVQQGPEDMDEIEAVRSRIRCALASERQYMLFLRNCQHFAHEMRSGTPFSRDADRMQTALLDGLDNGVTQARRFLRSDMVQRGLMCSPFGESNFLARTGNWAVRIAIAVIVMILLIAVFAISTGGAAGHSYVRRLYYDHDDARRQGRSR
eukprot:TRINITY_DN13665_c0_g1_i1.p1 TRINITY_DN13665_c0_g1~~TRINITY_DN13665_c0_g1_i1.p1  ORF type:complete len:274 (-),score=24.14 TRINITY_DN13665_c0_g1_i1:32-853(-)